MAADANAAADRRAGMGGGGTWADPARAPARTACGGHLWPAAAGGRWFPARRRDRWQPLFRAQHGGAEAPRRSLPACLCGRSGAGAARAVARAGGPAAAGQRHRLCAGEPPGAVARHRHAAVGDQRPARRTLLRRSARGNRRRLPARKPAHRAAHTGPAPPYSSGMVRPNRPISRAIWAFRWWKGAIWR